MPLLVFTIISTFFLCSYGDLFSAIADMEKILYAENFVALNLKDYVAKEQHRINVLQRIAEEFDQHSTMALKDPEKYLSNPINAFLLIKRFSSDWDYIATNYIKNNAAEDLFASITAQSDLFPSMEDLDGAARGLLRLQDTYALPSAKLATGDLSGLKDSPHMTAEDCYKIGTIAYTSNDYYHTVIWMNEALNIMHRQQQDTVDRSNLLDYLSYSYYMQGNVRKALNLTKDWLNIDPNHYRAQSNLLHYEKLLIEEQERLNQGLIDEIVDDPDKNPRPMDAYKLSDDFQNYEKLCRGEKTHRHENSHQLKCVYRQHHPYLRLRPIKEEEVSLTPPMFLFHDVMIDHQINKIKELGKPKLGRSVVYHNANSGKTTPQEYRISKSGWLSDTAAPAIRQFSFMSSILANLTLETVEDLQVLNYGIGGHYEPHYDFATNRELSTFEKAIGNRIATFICYLSDVEAGGATVFPGIGVSFWPRKGSCAFWYNLLRSGEGDMRTRHAACPVLSGIKWASNKWFHERGQEFIRQCSNNPHI